MSETRANVLFFILVIFALYAVWCVWDRARGPLPVDVTSVQVVDAAVPAGENLRVAYRVVRHEICGLDTSWVITDASRRRERVVQPHVDAAGPTGPDNFVRTYPVPVDMKPGPATLAVMVAWSCPNNVYENLSPKVYVSPPVNFIILPANSDAP